MLGGVSVSVRSSCVTRAKRHSSVGFHGTALAGESEFVPV